MPGPRGQAHFADPAADECHPPLVLGRPRLSRHGLRVTSQQMAERRLYRVTFLNQGQVYEVYARRVTQGGLLGFVEVDSLVFGTRTQVVVDPSEERLQREFESVKRFFVPMHAVMRIDEVEKQGPARISEAPKGGNITSFPIPLFKPAKD